LKQEFALGSQEIEPSPLKYAKGH